MNWRRWPWGTICYAIWGYGSSFLLAGLLFWHLHKEEENTKFHQQREELRQFRREDDQRRLLEELKQHEEVLRVLREKVRKREEKLP